MKVPFRVLPGSSEDIPRPMVDVSIEGLEEASLACLVDAGTLGNRFASWIAREAGIELTSPPESIALGGRWVLARPATVELTLGAYRWEAPVWFCEPWPWDFQLLGQEGFLRYFRVTIEAANHRLEIIPQR